MDDLSRTSNPDIEEQICKIELLRPYCVHACVSRAMAGYNRRLHNPEHSVLMQQLRVSLRHHQILWTKEISISSPDPAHSRAGAWNPTRAHA